VPHDRLRHQCAGHSRKLTSLTDFEYRVWDQYQLSADDFGVMRCGALVLQADNDALAKKPRRAIEKALDRLIDVGLVKAFTHQDVRYICDPLWQQYQKIQYPKQTINPTPPPEVLAECHAMTRELFRQCFGKPSTKFLKTPPENSQKDSGTFDPIARAPAREEAKTKTDGSGLAATGGRAGAASSLVDPAVDERAAMLLQRYSEIYAKARNGAHYHVKEARDFPVAVELVSGWPDDTRLDVMLEVFLKMDAREANNQPGTPGQFLHMAPECDRRLREHGR
jgi:hypothetical protein